MTKFIILLAAAAWVCFPGAARARPIGLPAAPFVMVYHDSWRERAVTEAGATLLATAPRYANIVVLAFAKPDLGYLGDLNLSDTGLNYRLSGHVLRGAIALLKRRNPDTRVLLSVGGSGYAANWRKFNPRAVSLLVRSLDLDGVDIDYEPVAPACNNVAGRINCGSDAAWIRIVQQVRQLLPRPYIVSVAAWSVGAFGEGRFAAARPVSPWTGSMLHLLRSPAAASIDLVAICSYDAGPTYDPLLAFAAYRQAWRGPLLLGIEVPFKNAGGPFFTPQEVETLARRLRPNNGLMIYSLLEPPDVDTIARSHANGRELARAACRGLRGASAPVCKDHG